MTNPNANPLEQDDDLPSKSELEVLKEMATMMGINFSNNIGVESLKQRIEEKRASLNAQSNTEDQTDTTQVNPLAHADPSVVSEKPLSLRQYMMQEQTRLVRLRITNMDPKKADLQGEILTVANEYLGTIRKFVPFGEATDNGYHVPYCLYELLKNREFLQIKTFKKPGGRIETKTQYVREFALEILPDLTEKELAQLKTTQAARGDVD
jgi:hypothetical protein